MSGALRRLPRESRGGQSSMGQCGQPGGGGTRYESRPGVRGSAEVPDTKSQGMEPLLQAQKGTGECATGTSKCAMQKTASCKNFFGVFCTYFFLKKHPKWGGNDNTKTKRDANLCSRKLLNNDTMISFCKISSKMVKTQLRDNGGSGGKSISLCKVQHPEKSSKVLVRQNIPCPRETVS